MATGQQTPMDRRSTTAWITMESLTRLMIDVKKSKPTHDCFVMTSAAWEKVKDQFESQVELNWNGYSMELKTVGMPVYLARDKEQAISMCHRMRASGRSPLLVEEPRRPLTMEESFLQDIIANPADDALRLIYADWLSEQGREEQGSFVRTQVEYQQVYAHWRNAEDDCNCQECSKARALNGKILADYRMRPNCPSPYAPYDPYVMLDMAKYTGPMVEWDYHRGLVQAVRIPCSLFLKHGPAMASRHPLERVELTDKKPRLGSMQRGHCWDTSTSDEGTESWLPLPLFNAMTGTDGDNKLLNLIPGDTAVKWYASEELAVGSLSRGCIAWARQPECCNKEGTA